MNTGADDVSKQFDLHDWHSDFVLSLTIQWHLWKFFVVIKNKMTCFQKPASFQWEREITVHSWLGMMIHIYYNVEISWWPIQCMVSRGCVCIMFKWVHQDFLKMFSLWE